MVFATSSQVPIIAQIMLQLSNISLHL